MEVQKILQHDFPMRPKIYLLGLRLDEIDKSDRVLVWYMVVAACQLYTRCWETGNIPQIEEWKQPLLKYAKLDKLMKKLKGKTNMDYMEKWQKLNLYFKSNKKFMSYRGKIEIY